MTLMMTVSGVRGIIGETMTPVLAAELGAAFGSHVGGGLVVVGRDSRPSGEMIASAMFSGLMATGCEVVDLGIVTTPGVGLMVVERGAVGGVVLTASHNPIIWNGIKFLTEQGFAPPPELAEKILNRYREGVFDLATVDCVGHLERDDSTHGRHVEAVSKIVDVEAIRKRRFKVVLDSVNGAGGVGGRRLLEHLGCEVVLVNGEPTGRFAHTPEPTAENLTGLCGDVRSCGASIGFAQDPDADRLAIVDDRGRYIGEEFTLVLAAKYVFARSPGAAAANLSTSRMIDDLAATFGGTVVVHRSAVGEANVARAMLAHKCVIGGEGNGGIIDPRVGLVRDSFVGMALVLNLLADEGRPLSEIVDELPHYVMSKQKFELPREEIAPWLDKLRENPSGGVVNDVDGVRVDWPEGWVHLRPSNTEPIARVIAEAADDATAAALVKRVTDLR